MNTGRPTTASAKLADLGHGLPAGAAGAKTRSAARSHRSGDCFPLPAALAIRLQCRTVCFVDVAYISDHAVQGARWNLRTQSGSAVRRRRASRGRLWSRPRYGGTGASSWATSFRCSAPCIQASRSHRRDPAEDDAGRNGLPARGAAGSAEEEDAKLEEAVRCRPWRNRAWL